MMETSAPRSLRVIVPTRHDTTRPEGSPPCAFVGRPIPEEIKEPSRKLTDRDKEFLDWLVQMAFVQWHEEHGQPRIAELYKRGFAEPKRSAKKRSKGLESR